MEHYAPNPRIVFIAGLLAIHERRERDKFRYQINKSDPMWMQAERERNRVRMRQKRTDPVFAERARAQQRAHKAEKWKDPLFREKVRVRKWERYNSDPSYRAAILARNKKYNSTPKAKIRASLRWRKEALTQDTLTSTQWCTILDRQHYKCLACGVPFSDSNPPTKDHIIPFACGGRLTRDNTQALCKRCNSAKRDHMLDYRHNLPPQRITNFNTVPISTRLEFEFHPQYRHWPEIRA